ncbi:MAG: lactate utilization protein [Desulfomonilaceae bacterium]|nr:lactate utilization protein [Desulfomonilaceae bacterium]
MKDKETVERFLRNAANAAAHTVLVFDVDAMNEAMKDILGTEGAVYCPRETEREKAVIVPEERFTDDYFNASICVEEVFGAIAETGSLICTSTGGRAVQANLLPSHHVALVSPEHIYPTLEDFFAACGDPPPTNITFITGPSRTADIELTLTIGVHGPERVSVIVC